MTTIYGQPNCPKCVLTRNAFEAKDIEHKYVDISKDQDGFNTVTGLGYQQVPVVVSDIGHWSGYRPDKIRELMTTA